MVNLVMRILGLNLLSQVGARSSNAVARTVSTTVLIAANLLPLYAVIHHRLWVGDVFVLYWLENVVVGAVTVVKILTCTGQVPHAPTMNTRSERVSTAGFFALHFGVFTLVHGFFAFIFAFLTGGFFGSARYWLLVAAALTASHVVSLALNWFGRSERAAYTPARAMWLPYPRMLVLHVAIIGSGFLLLSIGDLCPAGITDSACAAGGSLRAVAAVALLCGLKTLVDLGLHLRERFAATRIG